MPGMPAMPPPASMPGPVILIEPDRDGWLVNLPGAPAKRLRTATLHHARRLARAQAGPRDRVVVRDHYHRIVPTDGPVIERVGHLARVAR
jgi:hypothetical protein